MSLSKIKRGVVKNGVLLSLMMFYFSCGRDVFPPDFPAYTSENHRKLEKPLLNGRVSFPLFFPLTRIDFCRSPNHFL